MRTILRATAIAYFVYLAIAFLLILPALNFLPHWYVQQTFDRQLQTDIVLFNPFTLSLVVRRAELPEHSGERFAGLEKASVNLSLESLWREGFVFDAIRVKGLFVHVIHLADGTFNFSDMSSGETEKPADEDAPGGIPGVTIHDFDFHSQSIVLTDQSRETPYSSRWNGLSIQVLDLSTVYEEGRPYNIDVYGEAGGHLHWEGEVSVPRARSEGSLQLDNVSLRAFWRFAEPWVQFELKEGRLAVEGRYELDWADAFTYRVTGGQVGLSAIDIAPKTNVDLPDTAITLDKLAIANITVDSQAQHAAIDTITVDALTVAGWSEGAQVSLQQLFAVDTPSDPPQENEPTPTEQDDDSAGWTAAINGARVVNSSLNWRSEFTDPPLIEVTPIEASIDNINWPLSGDSRLSLNLTANQQAGIAIDGTLALADGDGGIGYKLDGLPLTWFNPNLPKALKAGITAGEVQVEGKVALAAYAPARVNLDGAIRNFAVRREAAEINLSGWDTVRFSGLDVDMEQHKLLLESLAINGYVGRLHIWEDGSINASNIWKEEVGDKAEEIAEDLTEDTPWSLEFPAILVTDSEIDFMDQSLPIEFRTVIGELNGEIKGISTDPASTALVEMKGSVDGYAPVALVGDFNPFSSPTALDLRLTFDGVDLGLLTPYSGTYAGYAIDRGLLNLDLKYSLKNNRLQGDNKVLIDKLKLGEKIDSEKAVDLPLELALALLTDSKGVIDLQVPVTGDVDDPQFDVGSVIFGAFVNLITKAITAPFTLLASLVDSEEDLQRVTFASGSAQLDEASKTKLAQLGTALAERPALSLVITGRLNLSADRERLQKNVLKQQLVEAGLAPEELKSKGPAWEKAIAQRYQALGTGDATAPTPREQYLAVVQTIAIDDKQLLKLAEQRAVAVKSYLVNDAQLDADRAVVDQTTLDDEANLFSGVELGIDS